jgi:hypothetical protein
MVLLFFNSDEPIQTVSKKVFDAIGLPIFGEVASENVLNGFYFSASNFGVLIKLELNSYDYEEDYKYMLSITKDATKKINPDSAEIVNTALIVRELLRRNLKIDIGQEEQTGLTIYKRL